MKGNKHSQSPGRALYRGHCVPSKFYILRMVMILFFFFSTLFFFFFFLKIHLFSHLHVLLHVRPDVESVIRMLQIFIL